MKIHLCCGDVYLDGYWNVDAYGVAGWEENPNKTTLEHYYKGKVHDFRFNLVDQIVLLPDELKFSNVDEYLMVSAFEHFSLEDAKEIVSRVYNSLNDGGVFRFDFPDIFKTVDQYKNNQEYMMRLIYGSGKNDKAFHKHGYTEETIQKLLMTHPWKSIVFGDIVEHTYPMIGVTATK